MPEKAQVDWKVVVDQIRQGDPAGEEPFIKPSTAEHGCSCGAAWEPRMLTTRFTICS